MSDNKINFDENIADLLHQYVAELQNESSDRAIAIVGAVLLESLLEEYLSAFMMGDTSSKETMLVGIQAPLGTFHSRILAAYHFGLITDEEKHDLNIVRKIRNDFAHDLGIVFEQQSIRDRCGNFKIHLRFKNEFEPKASDKPAHIYVNEVSMLATFLTFRIRSTNQIVSPKTLHFMPSENETIRPEGEVDTNQTDNN